ncbi:unnamed protein product [Clavelina lepadiformis]|uniref:AB hydrolase-1 domain-containing protein n=1 Tax=Clavelina lepadiformis TaxID=159417 RepID=A0ABP0FQS1_CLALP
MTTIIALRISLALEIVKIIHIEGRTSCVFDLSRKKFRSTLTSFFKYHRGLKWRKIFLNSDLPTMTGCCEYISSSKRGLTKEIEILVPWGIIAGKVLGDSTNPPVLCIHGWLDNCNTFDNLIPLLPKENFFVFIDLPGHGLSSHLPPGMFYSRDHYVFVVDQIANYFSWATFNLLGHSLEKVDKTICLDGVVYVNEYIDGLDKPDVQWLKGRIQYYNTLNKKKPKKTTYDKLRQRLLDRNFGLKSVEIADALLERGSKKMEDGNGHDGVMQRSVPKELRSFVSSSLEQSFRQSEVSDMLKVIS